MQVLPIFSNLQIDEIIFAKSFLFDIAIAWRHSTQQVISKLLETLSWREMLKEIGIKEAYFKMTVFGGIELGTTLFYSIATKLNTEERVWDSTSKAKTKSKNVEK